MEPETGAAGQPGSWRYGPCSRPRWIAWKRSAIVPPFGSTPVMPCREPSSRTSPAGRGHDGVLNQLHIAAAVPRRSRASSGPGIRSGDGCPKPAFPGSRRMCSISRGRKTSGVDQTLPRTGRGPGSCGIAVVGYITPEIKSTIKPELTAGLRFGDGELAIHDVLSGVKALRPDLTVVLAHAGGSCTGGPRVHRRGGAPGRRDRVAHGGSDRSPGPHASDLNDTKGGWHRHRSGGQRGKCHSRGRRGQDGRREGREVRTRIAPVTPDRVDAQGPRIAAQVEAFRRRADSFDWPGGGLAQAFPGSLGATQHRLGGHDRGGSAERAWRNWGW